MPSEVDRDVGRLADALVGAPAAEQGGLVDSYGRAKGGQYTLALALAIPKLHGEAKSRARESLATRLTRMTAKTLRSYLADEDAELRAAAARAAGTKEDRSLVPDLIALLEDADSRVWRAAHGALRALTGQDFGPTTTSFTQERRAARVKWRRWWEEQRPAKSPAPAGSAGRQP